MSADTLNLPIIDLSELDNENTRADFYRKLRHMARDVGFFYLVGHGIDAAQREDMLSTVKRFFALPQEAKDKISMDNSPHFRGYTRVGGERTRNHADYREQFDLAREGTALPERATDPDHFHLNLEGPNQWPAEIPELKEKALHYHAQMHALAVKLLRAFMVALEVPEDSLDELVAGRFMDFLKISHYPPNTATTASEIQEHLQGCGPHKDHGLLTLLWQDDVGGLQVLTDDKGWIDAVPLKDSFIVNIGETLELATNGYLIANIHQVVMKPENKKARYSIPFFVRPSLDAKEVPFLPLPAELRAQARGPSSDPLNPLFRDAGKNVMKGRLRSHLGTTKNFYPNEYEAIQKYGNVQW